MYVPDYDKGNLGESGTDLFYSVRCSNYEIKTKIHSTKHGTLFIIEYYNVMIWGSLWGRTTSLLPFGMGWKRDFGNGWPCGRGNLFPNEGESL